MLKIEVLDFSKNNKVSELIEFAKKNSSIDLGAKVLYEVIEDNEFEDNERVLVAYLDNNIIGFSALVNESVAEGFEGTPYLDFLFVEPNHRNKGVATALIEKVKELAKVNYNKLYLVTVSHESFYKKLGFKIVATSTVIGCIDECFIMKIDL